MIHGTSPYTESIALQKIKKRIKENTPPRIAFLDIDSTLMAGNMAEKTNEARQCLEELEYVIVFVTSKTEEMLMSEPERDHSINVNRPLPHLGRDIDGHRFYTDPRNTEPLGTIDPDIIVGSTGTNILIKQEQGYVMDHEYRSLLPPSYEWRTMIITIINDIIKNYPVCQIHPNEFLENFEKGKTDVSPPDYRVEVKFKTLKNKRDFVTHFREATGSLLSPVQLTDDSNPLKEKYAIFITPKNGTKVNAVEHIMTKLIASVDYPREEFNLFLAGDSYPDLAMGLYGGLDTNATFLLVGKSRLASFLVDEEVHKFADESLKNIKEKLVAIDSKRGGVYHFAMRDAGKRTVIIGDEAFPGTQGPETIIAYLKSMVKT